MLAFLSEWGSEIVLSLVIAMLTYYFKKGDKEKEKQVAHYQELLEAERNGKTEAMIEAQLEPIYKELEDIRKRVLALSDKENADVRKIDESFDLIIASYKYRLVQLCRELLNQGFMYQYQYDHLNEFYNLYTKLGGNGQAKSYYDKVCSELDIKPNPTV